MWKIKLKYAIESDADLQRNNMPTKYLISSGSLKC